MKTLPALLSLALASTAVAEEVPAPAAPAAAPEAAEPPAPPPAASPAPPAPAGYGKRDGLVAGLLVGPKVALLPIPSAWGLGLETRVLDTVGFSLDYGAVPSVQVPNAQNADARMEYQDLALAARWFPWSQRFYLGVAFGTRSFKASATDATTGLRGDVDVKSTFVAPELGWRFIWPSGFFMGIDLGWQIVTSDTSTFNLPAGMNAQDQQDLRDAADRIGRAGLPILSFLQLGFYL